MTRDELIKAVESTYRNTSINDLSERIVDRVIMPMKAKIEAGMARDLAATFQIYADDQEAFATRFRRKQAAECRTKAVWYRLEADDLLRIADSIDARSPKPPKGLE